MWSPSDASPSARARVTLRDGRNWFTHGHIRTRYPYYDIQQVFTPHATVSVHQRSIGAESRSCDIGEGAVHSELDRQDGRLR